MKKLLVTFIILIPAAVLTAYFLMPGKIKNNQPNNTELYSPIKNFESEITKKPFGVFISPQNSPIPNERFTGWHTGVDAEIDSEDIQKEIPVFSITKGKVVRSGWTGGYGGLIVIEHEINGWKIFGIYGHLNPENLPMLGKAVTTGQKIGTLGKGFSRETDFERKHLHFALFKGTDPDIRGYTATKEGLALWIDPKKFFKE